MLKLTPVGRKKTDKCLINFAFDYSERRSDDGSLDSFVCDVQLSSSTQVNLTPWRFERVTVFNVDNMSEVPLWKPYDFTVGKVMSEAAAAYMEELFQQAMTERVTEEILR